MSLRLHPEAFTDEALHQTFEYDQKSHVRLWNVPHLNTMPSRPANLPEYIIIRYGTPLKTNAQDMSLVDIIDFGKGSSRSIPIEYLIEIFFPYVSVPLIQCNIIALTGS